MSINDLAAPFRRPCSIYLFKEKRPSNSSRQRIVPYRCFEEPIPIDDLKRMSENSSKIFKIVINDLNGNAGNLSIYDVESILSLTEEMAICCVRSGIATMRSSDKNGIKHGGLLQKSINEMLNYLLRGIHIIPQFLNPSLTYGDLAQAEGIARIEPTCPEYFYLVKVRRRKKAYCVNAVEELLKQNKSNEEIIPTHCDVVTISNFSLRKEMQRNSDFRAQLMKTMAK